MEPVIIQIAWLFIMAIPVACISWTVTHEEVFREPRDFCNRRYKDARTLIERKFFYLFTCEYCFSHYVTILLLIITHYTLLLPGWRGYIISGFSVVWIANIYMSLYGLLKTDIKAEKIKADIAEQEKQEKSG